MKLTPYHAKYFAYELTKRSSSESVDKLASALSDAQVDLNPHQIEAALFAFRSPLSKGAILADEVGLGKTIEAGILLAQRWAERRRRLLVICPANLRKQWSQELADKFYLPSVILETRTFNEAVKRGNLNPFQQDAVMICSFQFARSKEPYVRQTGWELVVIDEAHRLRNVYKQSNKVAQAIKQAVAPFQKVLLTATPLQNSLLELFGLVSIIDEYTFGDLKSFRAQFTRLVNDGDFAELKQRLQPICQRTLRKQVLEYVPYTNRHAIVQEFVPSADEQRLYDLVSDYLQRPTLYALPASQRQLMTLILGSCSPLPPMPSQTRCKGLPTSSRQPATPQSRYRLPPINLADNFELLPEIEDEWAEDDEDSEDDAKPGSGAALPATAPGNEAGDGNPTGVSRPRPEHPEEFQGRSLAHGAAQRVCGSRGCSEGAERRSGSNRRRSSSPNPAARRSISFRFLSRPNLPGRWCSSTAPTRTRSPSRFTGNGLSATPEPTGLPAPPRQTSARRWWITSGMRPPS